MQSVTRVCWCCSNKALEIGEIRSKSGGRYGLVRCGGCGVELLWPQPDDATLRRAYNEEYYGRTRRKFEGILGKISDRFRTRRARKVSRLLPRGAHVLDVGCGNGGFLAALEELGLTVEGTEFSAEAAQRVPEQLDAPIHIGELTGLGLAPGKYGAISFWHVLEHVRDPEATLREAHRLLRPNGLLFLALPNIESWQARCFGTMWFHRDPPRHLFHLGRSSLRNLLEKSGFEEEELHTWSFEQNPFGVVQSILNTCGFRRDRAYDVLKGTSPDAVLVRAMDVASVAVLTGPAIAWSIAESLAGRGGTMTIRARARL